MPTESTILPVCPGCSSRNLDDKGEIFHPNPALVAGVPIKFAHSSYHLLACRDCHLWFKSPPVDEQALMDCYAKSKFSHWSTRPDPLLRRFDQLLAQVKQHSPGPDVLDIGCFNGAMLEYFGADYRRFGIEPSVEAAAVARERGVDVIAATVMDLPPEPRFDAVLAIDVLEHILKPSAFLAKVAAILRPGGVFISLTGDVGAWGFRMQHSRNWYCSLPEHVSFFSRASLDKLGCDAGLEAVHYQRTSHERRPFPLVFYQIIKGIAFSSAIAIGAERLPLVGNRFRRRAPAWDTARDHFLNVARRVGRPPAP